MAEKFFIFGAAYNGDGTSSNEAASAGAAGAWNQTTILTGTAPAYGTLTAGDTVNIRSKTSAGADITLANSTSGAGLGSAAATSAGFITWILDAGTVWPGVSGTLTFSTTVYFQIRQYNRFVAKIQDSLVFYMNNTSGTASEFIAVYGVAENVLIDFTAKTSTATAPISMRGGALINPHIKRYRIGSTPVFMLLEGQSRAEIINPDIEFTYPVGEGYVFMPNGTSGPKHLAVKGGQLRGPGATTGAYLFATHSFNSTNITLHGFEFPKTVGINASISNPSQTFVYGIGADGGAGSYLIEGWGTADSRSDGYYPTLSAQIPFNTPANWSWKVYPSNAGDQLLSTQMNLTFAKLFTDTAAAKTITQDVLIADTMSYDKSSLYIDVHYIDDSTGMTMIATSRASGSLDVSAANWSATTYGAVNLLKRKMSVTTPTAIKRDTMVTVVLRGNVKSVSANDILFVDPDPSVL